jgi:Domain of unknown function (DUF1788)
MGRIEELAARYAEHIATPWQRTVSGAQRVIIVVYESELERVLRARLGEFAIRTEATGHSWLFVDLTDAFPRWMADDEYRDAYFESPDDLELKINAEFAEHVAERIRKTITRPEADEQTVVAVLGVGTLFGFARVSEILSLVERDIRGRLVVFFPGEYDGNNNYRLLDARDGWNYLAVPITLHGNGTNK